MSGCGVGFKLVQAYAQKNRIPFEQISPLLDLLVVSIASDIVPLVGENRILAHFGLKDLNREPSKGLLSIIKICGLDKHNITIDDIVFKIGPVSTPPDVCGWTRTTKTPRPRAGMRPSSC